MTWHAVRRSCSLGSIPKETGIQPSKDDGGCQGGLKQPEEIEGYFGAFRNEKSGPPRKPLSKTRQAFPLDSYIAAGFSLEASVPYTCGDSPTSEVPMQSLKVSCVCLMLLLGNAEGLRLTHAAETEGNSWRLTKPEAPEGPRNEVLLAIDESWADYEQAIAKASEKLLKVFGRAIASATRKGDLGAVQDLTDAQKAFEDQGTLPTDKSFLSAVAGLKKQVATANTALMRSYTKAVATLTKNGDVEQAKRLQAEQDSVFAGVAVAGGPRKVPPQQWMADFSNEAALKKDWAVKGKYDLQVIPQAGGAVGQIKLQSGASMTTLAKYEGDLTIQLFFEKAALGGLTNFRISAWGHNLDFRQEKKHRLELKRKGNQLMYSVDGKPPTIVLIKDE